MENRFGEITAVIPAKLSSMRCRHKNVRPFNTSNLLDRKIRQLKQIRRISYIVVCSESDYILDMAKQLGAITFKNDPEFSGDATSGSQLFERCAQITNTPIMMYIHCVSPFISIKTINSVIDLFQNSNYDSILTSHNIKEFLWMNNMPVNYDPWSAVSSQNLPDIDQLTFGCNIAFRDNVQKNKNIIGNNPHFFQIDQVESNDIDTEYEFLVCDLLDKYSIHSLSDVNNYMNCPNTLKLLDCTIRDGGYVNDFHFTHQEILNVYKLVSQNNYDYCEIGFMSPQTTSTVSTSTICDYGPNFYITYDYIDRLYQDYQGCGICVMIQLNDLDKLEFKPKNATPLTLIRILAKSNILDDDELIQSKAPIIKKLVEYGYQLSFNIANCESLTLANIEKAVLLVHQLKINTIYYADTFGSMNQSNTRTLILNTRNILKHHQLENITIGFHAHNNCNDAIAKTIAAIDCGVAIVDSTIGGIGRGAGNLVMEDLLLHLDRENSSAFTELVDFSDNFAGTVAKYHLGKYQFGSNICFSIAAKLKCHPNYVVDCLKKCMSPSQIISTMVKLVSIGKHSSYDAQLSI